MYELLSYPSIGVGDSFWCFGRIEDGRKGPYFNAAGILLEEVMGTLGVGQLDQILEDIIGTSIGGLIPFLVARIELMQFEVPHSPFWISIELGGPVLMIDGIALEPLLKSHGTHDIIIRHGVEGVKGIFHTFLGT